jgi:bacterioferritin-associated ferredoxin
VSDSQSTPPKYLCYCNKVPEELVAAGIAEGRLKSPRDVYDQTSAGVGPCGGSCQGRIRQLLQSQHPGSSPSRTQLAALPRDFVYAISLFNRRYYWETHEVLENLWMNEVGRTRSFYQGIIQAAASLYHVLGANPKGVIKLAQDALPKIGTPGDNPWKIDTGPLISSLNSYKTQAEEILGQARSGFDYRLLPTIELSPDLNVED